MPLIWLTPFSPGSKKKPEQITVNIDISKQYCPVLYLSLNPGFEILVYFLTSAQSPKIFNRHRDFVLEEFHDDPVSWISECSRLGHDCKRLECGGVASDHV